MSKDINKITGYIRGGCSPIGMKKAYTTFIEESCLQHDTIIFSAGKIGYQIAMNPKELMKLIHAQCAHIIKTKTSNRWFYLCSTYLSRAFAIPILSLVSVTS